MKNIYDLNLADQLLVQEIKNYRERQTSSSVGAAWQSVLEFRQNMPVVGSLLKAFDKTAVSAMASVSSRVSQNGSFTRHLKRIEKAHELQEQGYIPEEWSIDLDVR